MSRGGGIRERVVKKLEAIGAEGRRVEEEDAGSADAAAHAPNPEAVEETAVLRGTVGTFRIEGSVQRQKTWFSRRKIHDNGDWFRNWVLGFWTERMGEKKMRKEEN